MSELWKPQPIEVYKSWINTVIDEAQDKLTHWETDFIHSISNQLSRGSILTERQAEILERIYSEKTS